MNPASLSRDSSSVLLISFLGVKPYNPSLYRYPGMPEPVSCRYGAMAFMSCIQNLEKVSVDKLLICGTVSSLWTEIPAYLLESADLLFAAAPDLSDIRQRLTDLQNTTHYLEFSAFLASRKTPSPEDHDLFLKLLKELEDGVNSAVSGAGLRVCFLEHDEVFSEYRNQIELLNRIRNTGLIDDRTDIYLDITYGMRIMPYMVFISFQSLCYTENLRIKRIWYSPEFMPKTDPLDRLDYIEKVKNRLRYLRDTDYDRYQEKRAQVIGVLPASNKPGRSGAGAPEAVPPTPIDCCFLDSVGAVLDDAAAVSRFRVTADPAELAGCLNKADCENNDGNGDFQSLKSALTDISYRLSICDYPEAAKLILNHQEELLAAAGNPDIAGLLKTSFAWAEDFAAAGDSARGRKQALKKLSSLYLTSHDYAHAVNSCYSAFMDLGAEYPESGQDDKGRNKAWKDKKNPAEQKSDSAEKKPNPLVPKNFGSFMKLYRAMFVHLNDNTEKRASPGISRILQIDEDNRIDEKHLRKEILKQFAALGVSEESSRNSGKHVMFTFIGSGDYGHTSYQYTDPFHQDIHDFDTENTSAIGVSLAKKLLRGNPEQEEKPLARLVIAGTRTSNWRRVLESLEAEFLAPLADKASDRLQAFRDLREKLSAHIDDPANKKGSIDDGHIASVNDFFGDIRDLLGLEIVFAATGDAIHEPETQREIVRVITGNVKPGDQISFDITHSYRIIPVISLCAFLYLQALNHNEICHVFYGEAPMERGFNELNGLKRSQLPDEAAFHEARQKIEEILKDAPQEKLLSGHVYDMRNLTKLLEYSAAVNQYISAGNIIFLEPLIKVELRKRDYENYINFRNGVILDNLSMFRASAEFLAPAVSRLREGINDPVLKTVDEKMFLGLIWVNDALDDRGYYLVMTGKAAAYLRNGRFMEAFLCCYQACSSLADLVKTSLFRMASAGKIEITKEMIVPGDGCDSRFVSFANAFNQKLRKGRKASDFKGMINSGKNKDKLKYYKTLSFISLKLFDEDWPFVQVLRNCFIHSDAVITDRRIIRLLSLPVPKQQEEIRKRLLNSVIPGIERTGNIIAAVFAGDEPEERRKQ
ncbi:MAG: hypothetical protein II922_04385 [Succinimonas sp.]|nr:hypothetical protein [Succinimonas sp.]